MLPLDPIAEIGPKKSMPLNASDDSEVIQVMRPGSPVALGTMEPIIEVNKMKMPSLARLLHCYFRSGISTSLTV